MLRVRAQVYTGPGAGRERSLNLDGSGGVKGLTQVSVFFFFLSLDKFAWWQDDFPGKHHATRKAPSPEGAGGV